MKFIFILALLASCAGKNQSASLMSEADLIANRGRPDRIQSLGHYSIYHYPQGEQYQIQQGQVLRKQWTPSGEQALIQYWRQHLHLSPYVITGDEQQGKLTSSALGLEVMFERNSGKVIYIGQYSSKENR